MLAHHARNTLEDWIRQNMEEVMSWTVALNIPDPLREEVALLD